MKKHLFLGLIAATIGLTASAQDSMNRKMDNKTDKMVKKMDNKTDKMNKKVENRGEKVKPAKGDTSMRRSNPQRSQPR